MGCGSIARCCPWGTNLACWESLQEARKLLEWLSSADAQGLFAGLNLEYPVNPAVAPDPAVAAWGEFKADPTNIAEAGRLQKQAVMLMDRAGYR